MVFGKNVGDGFAPFDDYDIVGIREVFGEVGRHEAGVVKTVKVIMNEATASR